MAQQTAVEWFIEQLINEDKRLNPNSFTIQIYFEASKNIIEQAKEMDKNEKIDAYKHGQNNGYNYRGGAGAYIEAEQYYNDTYKK